jgi:hypothetical protein
MRKTITRGLGWNWWPESSGSGQGTIAGFFEHVSEPLCFINRDRIKANILKAFHHAHISAQFIFFFNRHYNP